MVSTKKSTFILTLVYINVILYSTCFQFQRPLEPYLVEKLSTEDSKNEYAKLQSFFSVIQTIGSLLTGYLLDKFSTKSGFYITFIASALSYYLLSISTSMNILYVSKIPAIFQSGFLCAQVTATHLTPEGTERVLVLGRLTMCYSIGMIVGPSIGGWLGASGDYYYGAKLATFGSFLSILLTYIMPSYESISNTQIPLISSDKSNLSTERLLGNKSHDENNNRNLNEIYKHYKSKDTTTTNNNSNINNNNNDNNNNNNVNDNNYNNRIYPIKMTSSSSAAASYNPHSSIISSSISSSSRSNTNIYTVIMNIISIVWLLLLTKIISGFANAVSYTTVPLILKDIYHFHETDMGLFMSISSIINAIISGVFLAPLLKILGGKTTSIVEICLSSMTIAYIVQALFSKSFNNNNNELETSNHQPINFLDMNLHIFLFITIVLSIFQYVLSTTLTSESTTRVHDTEKGTLIGLEHSLFAGVRVFAPFLGVGVWHSGGVPMVAILCALLYVTTWSIWKVYQYTLFIIPISKYEDTIRREKEKDKEGGEEYESHSMKSILSYPSQDLEGKRK